MKKIYIIIILVSVLLIGCSAVSELKEDITHSNQLQYKISKLAVNLDNSLKFLKLRQKKLKINNFTAIGKESPLMSKYLKIKLEEELFKLGYIISTDTGIIEVQGRYIDLGRKIEVVAFINGEGVKVAESSIKISKDNEIEKLLTGVNQSGFLTLER